MRYSVVVGSLLVIILAYSIYWFVVANETETAVEGWTRMARSQGLNASVVNVDVKGYPFRIVTHLEGLTIGFPKLDKPFEWNAEGIQVVAEPWSSEHLLISLEGDQTFTRRKGGRLRRYRLTNDGARASLDVAGGEISRFSLAVEAPVFAALPDGRRLTARDVNIHVRKASAPHSPPAEADLDPTLPRTTDVTFRIRTVTLPETIGATLGHKIAVIQGQAEVHGELTGPLPSALRRWAAAGGTMEVTGLRIEWGPLTLEAAGTVTLDEQSRPLGAFEARAKGMENLVDSLEATGELDPEYASLARTALAAISERTKSEYITVPLTLQNGFLYMGPIPLAVLEPIGRL